MSKYFLAIIKPNILSASVTFFQILAGHTEEGGSAPRCGGRTHEHFLLLPADIFLPQTPWWCGVPPGGTRAGEFTYGNSQRSTLPHTASKANQGSRATWISVSKEASRGFRGRRRLLLVLLQFFPVARNPLVGRPVKSILPHIVKGQQSGTRQKKGKSSLHTLAMSAVESRAKYLGVLGTRFAPPPTVRLNCSRAPYQEQRIMPHNVSPTMPHNATIDVASEDANYGGATKSSQMYTMQNPSFNKYQ